ncbi:MAG TPA: TetR/AcrR family transcriptional regulator [Gemmatimonadaceae bacterium]|nr:TetR/AcrR family transcriptional regulator [Gemmatimonadaceae bacterium]
MSEARPVTVAAAITPLPRRKPKQRGTREATRQKLDALLAGAAALIAEKGFEATSMRDLSRAMGVSLAGLYHYAESKEELLYKIQHRTFASLLAAQEEAAAQPGTPEERMRRLVVGHLAFFTSHPSELKVCTYELESLRGRRYRVTEELRRRYYHIMARVIAELRGEDPDRESRASRHAALFIFGMLNWIFMWYDPARYGSVEQIGDEMIDLVLNGVPRSGRRKASSKRGKAKRR